MSKLDAEQRNDLKEGNFAFPEQRKEPLEDASHVRNAVVGFPSFRQFRSFMLSLPLFINKALQRYQGQCASGAN